MQRYCAATNMSVPVEPYVFSYDSGRQLMVCRNHKVGTKKIPKIIDPMKTKNHHS